jgi:hypothetical protein
MGWREGYLVKKTRYPEITPGKMAPSGRGDEHTHIIKEIGGCSNFPQKK